MSAVPSQSPPLRVAMVAARAAPYTGGVETHVDEVCARLAADGVDVTVLTTDPSGDLACTEDRRGYRLRRWPAYPRSRDYYLSPGLTAHLRRSTYRYDLVHVQGAHSLVAPGALAAARTARIPAVLTFHTGGHSSGIREALRPVQWRVMAPLLRSCRALVAVCEFERETFARVLRVPQSRIRLIPNGCTPLPVDAAATGITGEPLLVSVGRLERYKGHHRLLAAMPAILRRAPGARLALVGSGPYEKPLRDMAIGLGVQDRVVIRGFGADERGRLGKLVSDADLVCLLSDYEAHPVAVMEALAGGATVLTADTSGLSELGRKGLVTTIAVDAEPERLAAVALELAGRPRSAPPPLPSWDACAQRLAALYRDCLG